MGEPQFLDESGKLWRLSNLPFLSVYDSISGNTHGFDVSTMVLGGEGRDEMKRKSDASKGRPPCLSKDIFTSTYTSSPGPGEEARHGYSVKCCVTIQSSSDVAVAALRSIYSMYVKQEKSSLLTCACPVITAL